MITKKNILIFILSFTFGLNYGQKQTLDNYIKIGLQNSPALKDLKNQILSGDIDSLLVNATQKPQIDANGQIMIAPYTSNFGYDEAITNRGNYSGVVGISQNFFNRKLLNSKYESIKVRKQSLTNSTKITENDLKKTITSQYITAFSTFSEQTFIKSTIKVMEEEKELLKRLVEKGIYKLTDYLSLLIEVQSQELVMKQLSIQYYKDIRLLNGLCGINDTVVVELAIPDLKKPGNVDFIASPLFKQFRLDSIKILTEKVTIDVSYKPKINWFADMGINSSQPESIYRHLGFSAGINLNVPIYDGKQKKLNYQKLDIAEKTRFDYQEFYKSQFSQQIQQLKKEYSDNLELTEQLKKQRNTVEELINLSKTMINTGNLSIIELIITLKNIISINKDLNQLEIKNLMVLNELNYLYQK
jgi:outer membrane protein TolC